MAFFYKKVPNSQTNPHLSLRTAAHYVITTNLKLLRNILWDKSEALREKKNPRKYH